MKSCFVLASLVHSASTSSSWVLDGRLMVDGTPFFPVGVYVHSLNTTDWDAIAAAGYNTVLTYTNGHAHESFALPNASTIATTNAFLDNANARGIIVLLSLKDFYPDKAPTSTDVEALWKATVAAFVHHPALLGWYLADEVKTAGLGEVSARYAAVAAADPNHITYTVLDGGIMQRAGADGANYRNLSSVLGHDPYPWMNSTKTKNLIYEEIKLQQLAAAFGADADRALLTVSQNFNIGQFDCYETPANCYDTEPPFAVKLAASFLQPVMGSGGVLQFSYE
eukprot:gene22559-7986_t